MRHQLHDAVVAGGLPWSEAVRRMRSALGMTQEQFARAFRITKRQVAELEAGTANPTVATLGRLGRPFGFRVGFIHPGDEAATAGRPDAASDDA
ncbi:helix-turn-helix transcriptional regulator [Roseomonas sp. NAR14]|uniref:Helix-turn-helix transcriptional regulator n=1 Tax=Roseomonas acroporae TaxID=2937791 RepID=A0A9X1YGD2_9PROT|nr:helix-turn-helix transcriptional regulator [Roseomonas acroporae]